MTDVLAEVTSTLLTLGFLLLHSYCRPHQYLHEQLLTRQFTAVKQSWSLEQKVVGVVEKLHVKMKMSKDSVESRLHFSIFFTSRALTSVAWNTTKKLTMAFALNLKC